MLGVADSSKPGKELIFVINESDYEEIKEATSLVMKYKISDGDEILTKEGFLTPFLMSPG